MKTEVKHHRASWYSDYLDGRDCLGPPGAAGYRCPSRLEGLPEKNKWGQKSMVSKKFNELITSSHLITDVKQHFGSLAELRWETARELLVMMAWARILMLLRGERTV